MIGSRDLPAGEPLPLERDERSARSRVLRVVVLWLIAGLVGSALSVLDVFHLRDLPLLLGTLTGVFGVVLGIVLFRIRKERNTVFTTAGLSRSGRLLQWSDVQSVERVGWALLRITGAGSSIDLDLGLYRDSEVVVELIRHRVPPAAREGIPSVTTRT